MLEASLLPTSIDLKLNRSLSCKTSDASEKAAFGEIKLSASCGSWGNLGGGGASTRALYQADGSGMYPVTGTVRSQISAGVTGCSVPRGGDNTDRLHAANPPSPATSFFFFF